MKKKLGFSIFEVIATVALIGVMSAITIPNISKLTEYRFSDEAMKFTYVLQGTKQLNISNTRILKFHINNDEYCIITTNGTSCNNTIDSKLANQSGLDDYHETLPADFSVSGPGTISFDQFGRPLDSTGSIITTPILYTLSTPEKSINIQITPVTGYVQIL